MKKILLVSLTVILVLSFFLVGCGGETTTTTTSATTSTKPSSTTTTSATTTTTMGTTTKPTSTVTTTAPEPTGTIYIALTDFSAEATEPTLYESTWGWSMYDSLITTNEAGQYIGEVADSWSTSADGLTWTFKLRKDIKFWNGDPLTSADVLFTMQRFTSEESTNPWSSGLRINLDSISAPDPYTFVFKTKTPELPLTSSFAATRIIPKNYFESIGLEAFRKAPMGSGPWKFVEHIPETSFTLEANTEYWDTPNIPEFKYCVQLQVPEEATQIAMFKNGEIDIPLGLTTSSRIRLEELGFQTRKIGLSSPTVLNIQGSWLPEADAMYDIRLREALSLAIDRQELCDTIYEGQAVPGGMFALQPGGFGVTEDIIAPDPYDPGKAKQLMADAGYPGAFADPVIHLYTTAGPGMELMQAVQGYWEEVGFQVQIEILEATVWMAYFFNTLGMKAEDPNVGWIWAWTGGAADSTYMQKNLLTSYGVHQMLRDPEVDALWDAYITNTDTSKSFQMFNDFLRAGFSKKVCIGLVLSEPLIVVSPKLGEFTSNTHLYYSDAIAGIKQPK